MIDVFRLDLILHVDKLPISELRIERHLEYPGLPDRSEFRVPHGSSLKKILGKPRDGIRRPLYCYQHCCQPIVYLH